MFSSFGASNLDILSWGISLTSSITY